MNESTHSSFGQTVNGLMLSKGEREMTMTIIDEDGVHTVDENENVMCQECYATNDATHKRCSNCGSQLSKKMVIKKCEQTK